MKDDDFLAGLVGALFFGGAALLVVVLERGCRRFWRWIRRPKSDPTQSQNIETETRDNSVKPIR